MSNHMNRTAKSYRKPELITLGRIANHTGHCTSGCGHDSEIHPDEYKSATEIV